MSASAGTALADPLPDPPETPAAEGPGTGPYATAAAELARLGYSPVPVSGKKWPLRGYTGHHGEWITPAMVPNLVRSHGSSNVAIRLPASVLGLDIDGYMSEWDAQLWDRLVAERGELPATVCLSSRFGSGYDGVSGIRLYRVPAGRSWQGSGAPAVDIVQISHRYAMAPPSVHPGTGRRYLALDERTGELSEDLWPVSELPDLPAGWIAALERKQQQQPSGVPLEGPVWTAGSSCEHVAAVLADALAKLPHNRHDTALRALTRLARLGEQDHAGAGTAAEQLRSRFLSLVTADGSRDAGTAAAEWDSMRESAAAEVQRQGATPAQDRRGCVSLTAWIPEPAGPLQDGPGSAGVQSPQDGPASPAPAAVAARIRADDLEFWGSRPWLSWLLKYARHRLVPPGQLLMSVLVHAATETSPRLQLPALIGGPGSLNLYAVNVARAGGGKSSSYSACRDLRHTYTRPSGPVGLWTAPVRSPGSGEGIAKAFVRSESITTEDGKRSTQLVQHNDRLLLVADEVGLVSALNARKGSTLAPVLRTAFTGGTIGNLNAAQDRDLAVPAHAYRLGFLIAGQPAHISEYVADDGTGTAERFLYGPGFDAGADAHAPAPEGCIPWRLEDGDLVSESITGPWVLEVAEQIREQIRGRRAAALRGGGDTGGHGGLLVLKVAAVLALTDGRADIRLEDYQLAEWIHALSEQTRADALQELSRHERDTGRKRAVAEGVAEVVRADAAEGVRIQRLRHRLVLALQDGPMSRKQLRQRVAHRDRELLDAALDAAVGEGQIRRRTTPTGGSEYALGVS